MEGGKNVGSWGRGTRGRGGDAVADKQSGKATFFLLPLALGCVFPSLSLPLYLCCCCCYISFLIWSEQYRELKGNSGGGGADQLQCFGRHCVLTYFVMRFPRLHLPNGRLFGVSNRTFTFRFKFNSVSDSAESVEGGGVGCVGGNAGSPPDDLRCLRCWAGLGWDTATKTCKSTELKLKTAKIMKNCHA